MEFRLVACLKVLSPVSLLLLSGCGFDQLLFNRPPASPPPEPLPPARSSTSQVDVSAGLAPLPTPQQVLTAIPFGRPDPFAPLPAAAKPAVAEVGGSSQSGPGAGTAVPAGASAAPGGRGAAGPQPADRLAAPEGLRLTGVIRSGGRAEALVSYGAFSGSLRPGDRGGRSTDLLPAGWSLAAIQFGGRSPKDLPSITLQRGSQTVKISL